MGLAEAALLFLSALAGGAINSIAGGGSFLTFPALVFTGTAPLAANATSTAALWPGSVASAVGYRRELRGERALLVPLSVVSALGGLLGALGVLETPQDLFVALLPFLLLAATLVFTFGDRLRARLERFGTPPTWVVMLAQLGISLYGGYFGGGMGLMMLAVFSLLGPKHLNAMNALKSALGVAINATALVAFALSGKVDWPRAGLMVVAAVIGGYLGASAARKVDVRKVKATVTLVAWAMTVAFFVKTFG